MTSVEPITSALADLLGSTAVVCRQWAEQLEGPYRRGAQPQRRDLVEDRAGTPLRVGLLLADPAGVPITDGESEIWHCDAGGRYSGYPPPDDRAAPPNEASAPRTEYLPDQTFLRGRQPTDAGGVVEFATIYPGWYPGRTVHIHVMAHTADRTYTSQLYFPEAVTDTVFGRAPYRDRPDRDTTNATDEIFPTGREPAVLELRAHRDGYLGAARLQLSEA